LNIESEIIIKNWDEYEAIVKGGDYDVVRRGMVMQTTDELTNLRLLFPTDSHPETVPPTDAAKASGRAGAAPLERTTEVAIVESESQALKELKAMPIYFASSYALVKPYVSGFDANLLGVPSLKKTRIETGWTERKP
jgi:ABC-type oligopeptide transport system substrate-binding subunit